MFLLHILENVGVDRREVIRCYVLLRLLALLVQEVQILTQQRIQYSITFWPFQIFKARRIGVLSTTFVVWLDERKCSKVQRAAVFISMISAIAAL